MMRARFCVVLLVLLSVRIGGAFPARARVEGVVIGTLQEPIPFASVSLEVDGGAVVATTYSDRVGRFEFDGVPRGRFALTAAKPGYLEPPWRPGEPSRIIILADEPAVATVRLVRGAAIEGRVLGPDRVPLAGVRVSAVACAPDSLECQGHAVAPRAAESRADGSFRLSGLLPGQYIVGAQGRMTSDSSPVFDVSNELIHWAERALIGGSSVGPMPEGAGRVVDWLPTYYPAATSAIEATRVAIRGQETVSAVDIELVFGRVARISGVLNSPAGVLPRGLLLLPDGPTIGVPCPPTVLVDATGAFATAGCSPGPYRLIAHTAPGSGAGAWAEARLRVDGNDVSSLSLVLAPANQVAITVVDGQSSTGQPVRAGVRVRLTRRDVGVRTSNIDVVEGRVDGAGSLVVGGLLPGEYDVQVLLDRPGLWAKGLWTADGQELLDSGVSVSQDRGMSYIAMRLELSPTPSRISGQFTALDKSPASSYSVVAFPLDPRERKFNRRIKASRVAPDGSFEIAGLPTGEYFLGALGTVNPSDLDPTLFEALAAEAVRVQVIWGSETKQDIRLDTGGRVPNSGTERFRH